MKATHRLGILSSVLAIGGLLFSAEAIAQTNQSFTASVEVSSTLSLSEVNAMSFGQIVVVSNGNNAPTATLAANGSFQDNSAVGSGFVQLGTPSAGTYTIATGATTFSNITITFPAVATLAHTNPPPGNGTFDINTFKPKFSFSEVASC